MSVIRSVFDQLCRDEGVRLAPYRDSLGLLSIGVGHCLDCKPISKRAAMVILDDDICDAQVDLARKLPWSSQLDPIRQAVLVNMTFNLGIGGLLKFEKFLSAMRARDWATAAKEMLDSKWANQVGDRAVRLSRQVITGEWQ